VLFAAMSGSVYTVLTESIVMTGFSIAAVVGFKSSPWIVVGGLAGHGVFDALHGYVLETQGCQCGGQPFVSRMTSERLAALPGSPHTGRDLLLPQRDHRTRPHGQRIAIAAPTNQKLPVTSFTARSIV
jgi:hypothetical protein